MALDRVLLPLRSLRSRLMLWNAAAVALTGVISLFAVREGVRYALLNDMDQVLSEDATEIGLAFADEENYDWISLTEEMDRKALGHDFHQWFVQFYDRAGRHVWSSIHTPQLTEFTAEQRRLKKFTQGDVRLWYAELDKESDGVAAVCVGCSQRFVARDMANIDLMVMGVGVIVLLLSPVAGHLLTNRTIQPLAQMIRTTARLRPGELGQRMPIRGTGDELDSLARTINGLLDRITSYLQQEHDFLANAAHDLRTPLAAIRSSVEVALSGRRTEAEYHELLGVVIEQCSALQTLVNQLLLLAETDADRLQTDPEPVPLDEVVTRACEMFEAVAEFHGLVLQVGPLPPAAVAGNRHHLRQVVNNLLDNAIKFTAQRAAAAPTATDAQAHRGTIDVELVRDEPRRQLRLRISDTGIGIAAEHVPHIFERFYRGDPARGRDGVNRGSGLGLSICKAIVESHGGAISVKSKLGQGTTITVVLPLAAQDIDGKQSRRQQRAVAADA
jgi:signal transduction histidine kinase